MEAQVYLIDFSTDFPDLFHYKPMKTQVLWDLLLFFFSRCCLFSSIKTPKTHKKSAMYKTVEKKKHSHHTVVLH